MTTCFHIIHTIKLIIHKRLHRHCMIVPNKPLSTFAGKHHLFIKIFLQMIVELSSHVLCMCRPYLFLWTSIRFSPTSTNIIFHLHRVKKWCRFGGRLIDLNSIQLYLIYFVYLVTSKWLYDYTNCVSNFIKTTNIHWIY